MLWFHRFQNPSSRAAKKTRRVRISSGGTICRVGRARVIANGVSSWLAPITVMAAIAFGSITSAAGAPVPYHNVTFHENDTVSDLVITSETNNVAAPLTQFANLNPSFVNPGYTFSNWNTSEFGNGIKYSDGAIYDFSAGSTDLYAQWIPNTVNFYENSSGTDSTNFVESGSNVQALTLFANLSPAFSNPGYSFAGWNTQTNGLGASYANGAQYDFRLGDLKLYAQWTVIPMSTAAFTSTLGTGSVAPLSATQGTRVSLPSGSGLVNPGYTFVGWNTAADGSGTEYLPGSSFTLTANTTFYAQWTPNVYSVTFAASGGVVSPTTSSYTVGTSALTLPTPTLTGYTFDGWFMSATGGSLVGLAGSTYVPTGSITLYAQWTANVYVVTYDAGSGTVSPQSASYTIGTVALTLPTPACAGYTFKGWFTAATGGTLVGLAGSAYTPTVAGSLFAQWTANTYTVTFDAGGGSVSPTTATFTSGTTPVVLPTPQNGSSTFLGWFTSSTGGSLVGPAGATFSPTDSATLYARWQAAVLFTLTFDPNGGTGSIPPISAPAGTTVTLPGVTGLSRPGYTLLRWATTKVGAGAAYTAGSTMALTASTTLFAQWSHQSTAVVLGAVGPFRGRSVVLTAGMKRSIARLAATIKGHGYTTISLFGYAPNTGLVSLTQSISARRAAAVAAYLRLRLSVLHARVTITSAGEGHVANVGSSTNALVEVLAA